MSRLALSGTRKLSRQYDYSMLFDGTNRVNLGTLGAFGSNLGGAWSIACWFRGTNTATVPSSLFGVSNTGDFTWCYIDFSRSTSRLGNIYLKLRDSVGGQLGVEAQSRKYFDGRWHFLVCKKDSTNTPGGCKIYVDAVLQSQGTVANTGFATGTNFDRAASWGSSLGTSAIAQAFKGNSTKLYLFTRELSATEISDWYYSDIAPSSPFRAFKTDAGSGTSLIDSSTNLTNGTLDNASLWNSKTPFKTRTT